ncbi:hypothetical protein HQ533_00355 [Candidatus Woesearchaeota archaeon]|nr:hypothetical protein [Candidatus Woesearchaeota archaeon]
MFEKSELKEIKPENESTVYEDEGRKNLLDSDAIDAEEEGFMQGYDREETVVCGFCKKPLVNSKEAVEKELNNKIHRFCSESCLQEFEEDM